MGSKGENTVNRQEAIEKCRKLLQCSSDNCEEYTTRVGMAAKIMARYKIDELALNEAKPENERADAPLVTQTVYTFDGPRIIAWVTNLVNMVAFHNGCKLWLNHSIPASLEAAGTEGDLADVSYFAKYLVEEVEALTKRNMKLQKATTGARLTKTWSNNFRHGVVDTLSLRFKEAKEASKREAREAAQKAKEASEMGQETPSEPTYALATIDAAIVKLEQRYRRADEWATKKMRLRKSQGHGFRRDNSAYTSGRIAGNSIDLTPKRGRLVG